jgi:two-component system cell cycle response regulator CpdR
MVWIVHHHALCLDQGRCFILSRTEAGVEIDHEDCRGFVSHAPQAHQHRRCASEHERTALNILIAEDNDFTSQQYKTALEKKGHRVTLTKDGEECFDIYNDEVKYHELFKQQKNSPYDIVLLDQNMPRKTGIDTAKEIVKLKTNQRIIFLTAYGQNILQKVSDFKDDTIQIIQKPFSLDFLVKKIEGRIINSRTNRNLVDRIIGEKVNNLMTITQGKEAIR